MLHVILLVLSVSSLRLDIFVIWLEVLICEQCTANPPCLFFKILKVLWAYPLTVWESCTGSLKVVWKKSRKDWRINSWFDLPRTHCDVRLRLLWKVWCNWCSGTSCFSFCGAIYRRCRYPQPQIEIICSLEVLLKLGCLFVHFVRDF